MKKYLLLIVFISVTLNVWNQTITDIDGNIYNIVTIGTQVWMKENLKTTKYNDGTNIPYVTDNDTWWALTSPAYCWYNNDTINKDIYGALYNWNTLGTGKLCPEGWSVPNNSQWTTLEDFLINNGYNYNSSTTDNKLAKALGSDTDWAYSSIEGAVGNTDFPEKRNSTGFTALPGGVRAQYGKFFHIDSAFYVWSSSVDEDIPNLVTYRFMYYDSDRFAENPRGKNSGFYVRCIRDTNSLLDYVPNNTIDLGIYPNPAKDRLYLNNDIVTNYFITIFDIQGKQIMHMQVDSNPIDISSLDNGIYLVKIINSRNTMINKLLKE